MSLGTIHTNAAEMAAKYRGRAADFPQAIQRGLRRIMVLVHRGADANLSGAGAAWSDPVPRRRGVLARGMYSELRPGEAEIGNTAAHAWSVHSGKNPRWHSPPARPREFLYDATEKVDHVAVLGDEMAGAW